MSFVPSVQQQAAFDWVEKGRGNAILEAVAGAGKTTTLVKICALISEGNPRASVAFAAYNKKIADEIGAKLSGSGVDTKKVRAATFHSFGFSAWRYVAKGVKVEEKKMDAVVVDLEVPEELREFTKALVSLAKQRAVGVLSRMDDLEVWYSIVDHFDMEESLENPTAETVREAVRWGWKALRESIRRNRDVIDFDDMIYAPLIHNVRMWQNDWVLVDEAQDTNPARRALAKKMLKPGGRLIAVGDPHQAIYGFTGADNDALDVIAREFACARLPLTVTYRCPKAVVEHARLLVSHISAHESAPEGAVEGMAEGEFMKIVPGAADAILCRNTKPLVQLAFSLIRRRIACHVEGREIGAGLMALATKWKKVRTVGELRDRLDVYLSLQTEKLMAKGQEVKADALRDKVETLLVLMEGMEDDAAVMELKKVIDGMFSDTPDGAAPKNLTLSTVHKSKGREWGVVYLLGRNKFMPSPYARQDWQVEQERNLEYVAITRAMERLVEVSVA